jgi:tetratricopeptide (TPR) repeat protein
MEEEAQQLDGGQVLEPLRHSETWYIIARSISDTPHMDMVEQESRQRRKDVRVIAEREFRSRLPEVAAAITPEVLSHEDWIVWQSGAAAICDGEMARHIGEGNHLDAIAMMEEAILLLCDVEDSEDEVRARLADLVGYYNRRAVKSIENGKTGYALAKKLLGRALALTARPMGAILSNQDARLRLRATTLNNLGCLYRRKGQGHAALKHLEMALKIEAEIVEPLEDPASTHLNLCAILSGLQQHKVAIKHARTAIDKILSQIGVEEDLLDMIPEGHTSQARNLMIGYHNMACCYEAALDAWAPAKALDSLDRAIIIGQKQFAKDPIVKSMLAHRKALSKVNSLPSIGNPRSVSLN